MKRIAVFQSDLHVGGIQKSLVNFLSMLSPSEYQIDVFLFDKEIFYDLTEIKNNVCFHFCKPLPFLNRFVYFGVLKNFCKLQVNSEIYDVAIDFSSYRNECALGALGVQASKRVMWIHNDVYIKKREEYKYQILFHFFKAKFRCFDKFVAVSDGIVDSFVRETGVSETKICTIPNFVNTNEIFSHSDDLVEFHVDSTKYNLVSMGRLCHQKGFDILLNEFSEVLKMRKDIHLYLIGDGPDKRELQEQCFRLGIGREVTFLGNQPNPFPYLAKMDGFVLDSRYEGQGIVLWEAKALGLDLFFPKHLQQYNDGLEGVEDVITAISRATKNANKKRNDLAGYNCAIAKRLHELLETC